MAPHAGIDDFGVLAVPAVRHALSFQNQFCLGVLVPAKLWLTSTVCEPRTIRLLFGAPRPTRIQGTPLARTAGRAAFADAPAEWTDRTDWPAARGVDVPEPVHPARSASATMPSDARVGFEIFNVGSPKTKGTSRA